MSECFYKYSVLKRLANFSSIAQFFKSALWPSTLCVCYFTAPRSCRAILDSFSSRDDSSVCVARWLPD